jgi:hypothetical protein
MHRLKANFEADWLLHLRERMIKVQGWSAAQVSALGDGDVCFRYFDALRRRITAVPRAVTVADDFVCPPEHQAGSNELQKKVRKGQDINANLSKRHASLVNLDGIMAEWGVHHFHLGVTVDSKNPVSMESLQFLQKPHTDHEPGIVYPRITRSGFWQRS